MNKNESKYFNTAILFDEALIYLLENKDIEYITIKEICNKAGVNRSTFYLHYENINDLVEETMNYINKKFMNYFNENTKEFIEKIKNSKLEDLKLIEKKYLTPYLSFDDFLVSFYLLTLLHFELVNIISNQFEILRKLV